MWMLVTQWIMPFWVGVCGQEAALVVVPSETNTFDNFFSVAVLSLLYTY